MGNKAKLTLFIAVVALVPSILEYLRGYSMLTTLLVHVLLALAFAVLAVTLLYAGAAIFKIQNFETRARQLKLQQLDPSLSLEQPGEGVTSLPGPTTDEDQ
jgi:hypothetical protein